MKIMEESKPAIHDKISLWQRVSRRKIKGTRKPKPSLISKVIVPAPKTGKRKASTSSTTLPVAKKEKKTDNSKTEMKNVVENVESLTQDNLPWVDLMAELRLKMTGTYDDDEDFELHDCVWFIDENKPRIFTGQIVKKIATPKGMDTAYSWWTVEVAPTERTAFEDEWTLKYPSWMLFKEKKCVKKVFDTLRQAMNTE